MSVKQLDRKREGRILRYQNENKAKIGKYASENGQSSAVRHFSKAQTYIYYSIIFIIIDIREEFALYYST